MHLSIITSVLTFVSPALTFSILREPNYVPLRYNMTGVLDEGLKVPGDSPAHYVGDNSRDILEIGSLTLTPNPPIDHIHLHLVGTIKQRVGPNPTIRLTVAINGTAGPAVEGMLCPNNQLTIRQGGNDLAAGVPPTDGAVEMTYEAILPYTWLERGYYTVRAEMYTSDSLRMTDFEGTVWVDGKDPDKLRLQQAGSWWTAKE